ncbi:Low-density lipoprotein receptor 1 [Larimichthys crocea]|uniref:Low-density lipoprotein receptor 1 n=1 Tax=Larimichthys crocea TaxID=215358 RepID=A0A6G0HUC1_LARCR|nr:Low-density lipoprotein receptor 1 [Larimichthys crocea]
MNMATNEIYWSDISQKKIYRAQMDSAEDSTQHSTVMDSDIDAPEGIAFDWIHGNLLNKTPCYRVDPHSNFIYWTDWGNPAKIEKAGLNGGDRTALVTDNIVWPNGITLDQLNQRLYWVDSKLHTLSSIDVQGGGRRTLIIDEDKLAHPLGLTVFEERVFWTDVSNNAILSANRLTGGELHHWQSTWHPRKTLFCTITSNNRLAEIGVSCATPEAPLESQVPPTSPPRQPPAPASTTAKPQVHTTTVPIRIASTAAKPVPRTTTIKPPVRTTTPEIGTTTPQKVRPKFTQTTTAAPVTTPDTRHGFAVVPNTASTTPVALYIVLPLAIICLVAVGAVLLWRSYRLKNTNTIHFDNPVYQKTTEDQVHIWRSNSPDGYSYPKRQVVSLDEEADNPAFTEN